MGTRRSTKTIRGVARGALVLMAVVSSLSTAWAADVSRADYERMLEARYSAPVGLPPGGLTWTRDVAT